MDLSIVVVNFGTPELSARALHAAVDSAGGTAEAIVVDNGSGDSDALAAALPEAQIVVERESRGFAAGVNAGLRAAAGEYVAVVNSDAFCRDDAVARLVGHLAAHPGVALAAPALVGEDGRAQLNAYRRFPNLLTVFFDFCFALSQPLYGRRWHPLVLEHAAYGAPRTVAHVMGAAFVVRAAAVRDAGPLDDRFFLYLEETEWQRRLTRHGWSVALVPQAQALHLGGASTDDSTIGSDAYLDSLERYHRGRPAVRRVALAGLYLTRVATAPLARLGVARAVGLDGVCAAAAARLRARRWTRWPAEREPVLT